MKNTVLKSFVLCSILSLSSYAYTASDLQVNAVGYKTAKKVGVPITFDKFEFSIKENKDFAKFMKSASINIDVYSLNSKMKYRDNNITSTLFKLTDIKEIKARVVKVKGSSDTGVFDVEISMNNVTKIVKMPYSLISGILEAKGRIDILDFALSESFAAFAKKCKGLHAGKSFSDVEISFNFNLKK